VGREIQAAENPLEVNGIDMPVRKFRTLIEASRPEKLEPGTWEFSLALYNVFRLTEIFAPPKAFPPGAYKFRSIEQAQTQKRAWIGGRKLSQKP